MKYFAACCALTLTCVCALTTPIVRADDTWRAKQAEWYRAALEVELKRTADLPMYDTPSGLRYQVLQEGQGSHPVPDGVVAIDYRILSRGDGSSGASTYNQRLPDARPLDQFTTMREALALMSAGAKYRLFLPAPSQPGTSWPDLLGDVAIIDVELLVALPPPPASSPALASTSFSPAYFEGLKRLILSHARYPTRSQGEGEEGDCSVKAVFAGDGHLTQITLMKKTAFERLDRACLGAVYETRRFPPVSNRAAADLFEITVPLSFTLEDHAPPAQLSK